jgi:hypothetical protein
MFLKFSIAALALVVAGVATFAATFAGVSWIQVFHGLHPAIAFPVALAALSVGWLALAD